MKTIRVALLGLGTVGTGVYETIYSHQLKLREALGSPVEIVGVLVKDRHKQRDIHERILVTTDIEELLNLKEIDVVFEAIVGIEPANSYIRKFLKKGCHVISANKELLANKGNELTEFARNKKRLLTFEAAVAGGVPLIRTITQLLQINGIVKVEAILNGTSNYILTRMRKEHLSYQEVLLDAQNLGYAEADPSNDILGIDSFYKLMILSNLIYGEQPEWENVERIGIKNVSTLDLIVGEKLGLRLKLIATLTNEQNRIFAEVKPTFVDQNHQLFNVEGVDNGIVIKTDLVGSILLQGPGAGSKATASAMIEDLVYVKQQVIQSDVQQRFSYRGEEQEKSLSAWLSIINAPTSKTLKNNYLTKSNPRNFGIEHVKREMIKTDHGYIVGDLLVGKREDVLHFLQKVDQESLRFYEVSSTNLKQDDHSQHVLQTTIL
ncbi:homoserine dehydrogenase [Bacillus suaedaesalsae]|uniref:Homoserine dehydrogenase n=1 Tax=Bacillus suaedaesalsae TaxID=2810349 RepID=A0ABS2DN26_9BACI|nr:homoserine dehydrogenase [Bacillus suaedaesalsae]MBM6618883.1 homoserine dehydrogenase [Bacillus suaedaesalsae]